MVGSSGKLEKCAKGAVTETAWSSWSIVIVYSSTRVRWVFVDLSVARRQEVR